MADGYQPTHAVPATGLPAWPIPDGTGPPAATLDPGLDVEVFERRADWAHVRCSNGWEAWIDGRNLVVLTVAPAPAPAAPAAPVPVPAHADAPVPEPHADAPAPVPAHADAPAPVPEPQADAPAPEPHADAPAPVPTATVPVAAAAPDPWAAGAAVPPRRFDLATPQILVLVGSVLVVVAALLPWLEISRSTFNAFDVPVKFLGDGTTEDGGLKIGVLLAVLAGLGIVSVFVRPVRWFGIVTGVLVLGIAARFIMEVDPLLDDLQQARVFEDRFDVLKYGTYLAIAGGVLALVGGILSLRKAR